MIDTQLMNKVVLVTGANHGIGAATTKAFAEEHAKVFITYYLEPCRFSEQEMKQAREAGVGGEELYRAMQQSPIYPSIQEIQAIGGACATLEADLSETSNIPILMDQCEASLGPVDILVMNHTYCAYETFDPALVT